jgi:hypothetical protein
MKKYKFTSLFEMSNVFPEKSGLSYKIWLSTKSGKEKNGARIKLEVDRKFYSLIILADGFLKWKKEPSIKTRDMKKVLKFVEINKQKILDHWNGLTSSSQFTKSLTKVE